MHGDCALVFLAAELMRAFVASDRLDRAVAEHRPEVFENVITAHVRSSASCLHSCSWLTPSHTCMHQ